MLVRATYVFAGVIENQKTAAASAVTEAEGSPAARLVGANPIPVARH